MKPVSDSIKNSDNDSGKKPDGGSEGIDALKALQAGAVFICLVLGAWLIFHNILNLF
jgi:hypothetical protein